MKPGLPSAMPILFWKLLQEHQGIFWFRGWIMSVFIHSHSYWGVNDTLIQVQPFLSPGAPIYCPMRILQCLKQQFEWF